MVLFREELIKFDALVKEKIPEGTEERNNVDAYINMLEIGISALEKNSFRDSGEKDAQIASVKGLFRILQQKVEDACEKYEEL